MGNCSTHDEFFAALRIPDSGIAARHETGRNYVLPRRAIGRDVGARTAVIGLIDFRGDDDSAPSGRPDGFITAKSVSTKIRKRRPSGRSRRASCSCRCGKIPRGHGRRWPTTSSSFASQARTRVPVNPDLTNEQWIEWARPIWYGIRESRHAECRPRRARTTTSGTSARCNSARSSGAFGCGAIPANWCCRRLPASGQKATRRFGSGAGSRVRAEGIVPRGWR